MLLGPAFPGYFLTCECGSEVGDIIGPLADELKTAASHVAAPDASRIPANHRVLSVGTARVVLHSAPPPSFAYS